MNPDETAELVIAELVPNFDELTDRELLLSMARDIYATKLLIAEAVGAMGPLLNDPKLKLMLKMFR